MIHSISCSLATCASNKGKFLCCIEIDMCISTAKPCFAPGLDTSGEEHIKCSLPCCQCGIVTPNGQCIDATANTCCLWKEVALPPTADKPCGCGICFLNCAYDDGVKCGCFKSLEEVGSC